MITYTNEQNIPDPIYRAIVQDDYAGSNEERFCSVSDLYKPIYQWALGKRCAAYAIPITKEAVDEFWILLGKALHLYIEQANLNSGALIEQRFSMEINDKTLTGGPDYFDPSTGILYDYKVTSIYTHMGAAKQWLRPFPNSRAIEWQTQLNAYAMLLRNAGYDVKEAHIITICRDWMQKRAELGQHPGSPINTMRAKLYPHSNMVTWAGERMDKMEAALEREAPEPCSPEEMWQKDPQYKVKLPRRVKAVKARLPNEAEAEAYIEANLEKLLKKGAGKPYITFEPTERTRCEQYCLYSNHCEIHEKYLLNAFTVKKGVTLNEQSK